MDNLLSSKEVCCILKACVESQVSVLKFRELYVRFDKPTKAEPSTQAWEPMAQASSEQIDTISKAALEEDNILTAEERLALLAIEDPLEYERLLHAEELEKD